MGRPKIKVEGDLIADLYEAIDKAGGNLKEAADVALRETQKIVQTRLNAAAGVYSGGGRKGYAQGEMYSSIIKEDGRVEWEGTTASIDSGFDLSAQGGYHSIFIMYGTPRIAKDSAVFNAIKGSGTQNAIKIAQAKALQEYLSLGGK